MKVVNVFPWQKTAVGIVAFCDSDWAGCTKTRKSTSGGLLMMGKHLVMHWSSTQATIVLSSAEAELNTLINAFNESLGIRNMYKAMGKDLTISVMTDSSAARGIVHRTGCGKVKHLEARQLWIQEYVENKSVCVAKVGREDNPSDALTHHWSGADGYRHLDKVGLVWR